MAEEKTGKLHDIKQTASDAVEIMRQIGTPGVQESMDKVRQTATIASIQNGKYADLIMHNFKKRIVLGNVSRSRLGVDLYNEDRKASITLSQKELRLVHK